MQHKSQRLLRTVQSLINSGKSEREIQQLLLLNKKQSYYQSNGAAILPLGVINIKTGKNKMLDNIYDTWEDSNMVAEIWNVYPDKQVVIFTSGSLGSNGHQSFKHDQTGKLLFDGTFVQEMFLEDLKDSNLPNMRGFVYK